MKKPIAESDAPDDRYQSVFGDVSGIIDAARRSATRSVNAVMTAAYWLIGRHIVEFEQPGEVRTEYRAALVGRLSADLVQRFGRGFSRQNPQQMRVFYLAYPPEQIRQTVSGKSGNPRGRSTSQAPTGQFGYPTILQTLPRELGEDENLPAASADSWLARIASRFPLPRSAYVRRLSVKNERARKFYEVETLDLHRKIRWQ